MNIIKFFGKSFLAWNLNNLLNFVVQFSECSLQHDKISISLTWCYTQCLFIYYLVLSTQRLFIYYLVLYTQCLFIYYLVIHTQMFIHLVPGATNTMFIPLLPGAAHNVYSCSSWYYTQCLFIYYLVLHTMFIHLLSGATRNVYSSIIWYYTHNINSSITWCYHTQWLYTTFWQQVYCNRFINVNIYAFQ